ncbi:tripartite tricarboxylate transporter permease [Phytohabitans kaempferiae]|uniref:Tripartite tricarboxylate transporter permease n=1 Tax=Phytohabitans kaempferiae TaxID=1620943 RepID=A0ABV6MHL5_9ACTN
MDMFNALLAGFGEILTPTTLAYALVGCLIGMLTGVIPGFGPAAACSLLLPITFALDPVGGIIMLLGIYYGSMYGGTITSVLLNVPGEVASVVTCIDGYQMTKQGRAGKALAIAAVGSFAGGVIALVGMLGATTLAEAAITLGPVELFGLTILALTIVVGLAGRSMTKALISALLGLFVGMVGLDPVFGDPRFTMGTVSLMGGISFIAVVMGLFGVAEILESILRRNTLSLPSRVGSLHLSRQDLKDSAGSIGRGSVIGFLFGLIPGSPAAAATFASYVTEKKFAKHPERFGKGAIQGVAGPETANNSLGISSMIPLLSFGIPASPTMAIVLGAFLIQGLQPGPLLFRDRPDVAWTIIAGLFVANVMLLILSLPLVRLWVSVLRVPYQVLYPITLAFMMIGAYTVNNSVVDVAIMWIAGLVGFVMRRLEVPLAPAALTIILGPMIEANFRTAMSLTAGDSFGIFRSPLTDICILVTVAVFVARGYIGYRRSRASRRAAARPRTPDISSDNVGSQR